MGATPIFPQPMYSNSTPDTGLPVNALSYGIPLAPTAFPSAQPLSSLERKAPEYSKSIELWGRLAILYIGGWDIVLNAALFLRQRHKEPQDVYMSRVSSFIYFNITEQILGWFTSYLFRREPEIDVLDRVNQRPLVDTTVSGASTTVPSDTADITPEVRAAALKSATPSGTSAVPTQSQPPVKKTVQKPSRNLSFSDRAINTANDEAGKFYTEFRSNVDGARTSLSAYFSKIITHLLLNGRVFILTDLEPLTVPVANRLQAEQLGANKPYLSIYNACDVINYRSDRQGNLVWAVIKSARVEQPTPFDSPVTVEQWWIYDRTSWALYEYSQESDSTEYGGSGKPEKMALLVNSGFHALYRLNRCPLRMFEAPDGLWLGRRVYSPVTAHVNEDNALAWLLAQTNLAVPVITGGGSEPGGGGGDSPSGETKGVRYYSEIYAINLPQGAKFEWTSPSGAAASTSITRIEKIVEETYRLCYLQDQGRSASSTPSQRSGYAINQEKMPSREVAEALGRFIRDMITKEYEDVIDARHEGEAVSASVRGFSFLENYIGLGVEDALRLKNLGIPSPTLMRYAFKVLARQYMQDAPTRLLDMAIAEIEANLTDEQILDYAASVILPVPAQDEQTTNTPTPIPARVELAEASG